MTTNMRTGRFLGAAALILSFWAPSGAQRKTLDRIVAVVGREAILLSDLTAQVEFYVFNNKVDPATPGLQQQVLEAIINDKLVLAKAQDDTTISVSDEEVNSQLDALVAKRVQEVGSEKKVEELYGMPVARMKREFRDDMKKRLLSQNFQQKKFGEMAVSRREVEAFYTQYRDSLPHVPEEMEVYHIFKVPAMSMAAKNRVLAKAKTVLDSIRAGGDFADFARRYSDDPASGTRGGDLGFARRGQLVKEFEEAVFALKEQQLAEPVETVFGIHIVQLLERRGESVHARQILFKIPQDTSTAGATIAFLRTLKDSVAHGAPFSDLARKYSEDKETGPRGGYLGRASIDQFDKLLQRTVNELKEGEISDPVEVPYGTSTGYHIVYIKKRIPDHAMNLNDDWKRLEQLTMTFKQNTQYQQWLKQLRQEIYWDIRL